MPLKFLRAQADVLVCQIDILKPKDIQFIFMHETMEKLEPANLWLKNDNY